uniref:ATP-binding protein n=1 Tax=Actinomadura kijaniata TaxID=46161 RepID=UPI00082FCCCF
ELWRGEPLGEFADRGFARPVVARLHEVRAAALEDAFEARLALGEAAAAVPGLEALLAEHPYRERAWRLLVLALYRSGRQADAVAALRRVRERLSDEMGLDPGPELRELERAVFEQSAALLAPAGPAPADRPPERPVTHGPVTHGPVTHGPVTHGPVTHGAERLVARDAEWEVLERRLTAARQGRGGVLLVSGEAGVGKTRLAQAAAEHAAARGFRVAWGRCSDGLSPGFWPWIQIMRRVGGDAGPLTGDLAPGGGLFELYERVLAALTGDGTPLLLVLDDLHWADVSSLRLLAFVADAVAAAPVLVVATLRPEPGDHPEALRDTLGALTRQSATERIALEPFTAGQIADYLRTRGVPDRPERVAELLDRTGGNPFYLGEVLRDGGGVPAGARDVIEQRVGRLAEETRTLLRVAAVAGRDIDADVVAGAAGRDAAEVLEALDPAVATGLAVEAPEGPDYRFAHALVQETLYAGLGRLERARLHLRVGEALEARGADSAVLAHHFARAARVGGAARTAGHAAAAARQATARLAYDEAVQLWEQALRHLPRGDDAARARALAELGQARRTVGDAAGAHRDLTEAMDLAERAGDHRTLVTAVAVYGEPALWHWWPYGTVNDRIVAVVERLLAGPLDDTDRAVLLGVLGVALVYGPRREEGERAAAEAVEIARRTGDPALRARTLADYLLASFVPGRNAARLAAAEEMLAVPGLPRPAELVARVSLMACLLRAGDLARWDRELARCERLLDGGRRPELETTVRIAQTARATLDGRWEEAEDLLERHAEMLFGSSVWGREFRRLVTLFTIRRGQGRGAELLDDLVGAAEEAAHRPLRPVAVLAAVEAGRADLARDLVERWGHHVPRDWTADFLTPVWGLVAARLGTPDPAVLYEELLPHADLFVVSGMGSACWGSTHLVLAELAARLGRPDRAREHARAALDVHRALGLDHWAEHSERLLKEPP